MITLLKIIYIYIHVLVNFNFFVTKNKIMGSSTFSKHDLEMIEISWSFVRDKQNLGLNAMIKYNKKNLII